MNEARTVLAFDYGERRIGVAAGNTGTGTATALTVLGTRNGKPDWPRLADLVREWEPQLLILGLPGYPDDAEHPLAGRVERFARQLRGRFTLPVQTIDEHLTSHEAAERAGDGRGNDAIAAQIILETWLNERTRV